MNVLELRAKRAFKTAVINIRFNAKILQPFVNHEIKTKKDFKELADNVGMSLAEDFTRVKYGKNKVKKLG